MATVFLIALIANAELAFVGGAFVAGSMNRTHVLWAASFFVIGLVALLAIFSSSLPFIPSILDIDSTRIAKEIVKSQDYPVVIQGVLIGIGIPCLGLGVILWCLYRRRERRRVLVIMTSSLAMGLFMLGLILLIFLTNPVAAVPHLNVPSVQVERRDLSHKIGLLPGFEARAYLPIGVRKITSIDFDSADTLFVATQEGVVLTVKDEDSDGYGDKIDLFASKDGAILGITVDEQEDVKTVYISGGGEVLKVEDHDFDYEPDASRKIVENLPSFIYSNHSNNGIVVGPDEKLYMAQGGTSGDGPETHPLGGTILAFNNDGSDLEVYASGLRNSYDLVFTSSGLLVATDNSHENDRDLWYDEINLIVKGGHYGYPKYAGNVPPETGTQSPIHLLPMHVAPTGIVEYSSDHFPAQFKNKLFLSLFMTNLHGSKVVAIAINGTEPGDVEASVEDFAEGFGNPIDVAVDSRGRLYVADYTGEQVYQIEWTGDTG